MKSTTPTKNLFENIKNFNLPLIESFELYWSNFLIHVISYFLNFCLIIPSSN